ncbi:hypothetical protein PIROE2DRAFT_60660 [Piromyces sp. E2]|nr:hypothetical protein PIROE2DRAFT_60660 [Piromyces sp. E2]|eukprot:OUM64458.1 hypothetical protein PIROE2DRAFT_60660 [Piromyces sp. E2]
MIPIPNNNNNINNDNSTSPSKKLISDIVKKTFKNIVGKKKNFSYNQIEDDNEDVELDSYEHSNQYSEQESTNSLTNNKLINSGKSKEDLLENEALKFKDFSEIIKSNNSNTSNNNIVINTKNSNNTNTNTINSQLKDNSLSITKSVITSSQNSNIQINVSQSKTTTNTPKLSSTSNNKNLHIQTNIKLKNDTIESATTPHSSIKSSTISSIISHTKPIGVATSKLISSSSAVINNTLPSAKRAKAKANAEAAFQAEIDIAFDGDDFERDIREGIGFSSIKNKSYNRKKEFDGNVSGYSSTASVDSSIEVQGQSNNFANRLKNWTGFSINEVDYAEHEPKTPK